jgi:hypothetical protein
MVMVDCFAAYWAAVDILRGEKGVPVPDEEVRRHLGSCCKGRWGDVQRIALLRLHQLRADLRPPMPESERGEMFGKIWERIKGEMGWR